MGFAASQALNSRLSLCFNLSYFYHNGLLSSYHTASVHMRRIYHASFKILNFIVCKSVFAAKFIFKFRSLTRRKTAARADRYQILSTTLRKFQISALAIRLAMLARRSRFVKILKFYRLPRLACGAIAIKFTLRASSKRAAAMKFYAAFSRNPAPARLQKP